LLPTVGRTSGATKQRYDHRRTDCLGLLLELMGQRVKVCDRAQADLHGRLTRRPELSWCIKALEGLIMSDYFPDHGLPLVQLKERRRDLVIALRNRKNPPAQHELMEIASVQQAIFAIEEVIANWDAEVETDSPSTKENIQPSVFRRMR